MKTYLILKRLPSGFQIKDIDWDDKEDEAREIRYAKEVMLQKIKEFYNLLFPVTRIFGEVSDIEFSELNKIRDDINSADNYCITGTCKVKTNKLLSVLDTIIERYHFIKRWGFNFSQLIYLTNDIISVLNTDFKELERISLLELEE